MSLLHRGKCTLMAPIGPIRLHLVHINNVFLTPCVLVRCLDMSIGRVKVFLHEAHLYGPGKCKGLSDFLVGHDRMSSAASPRFGGARTMLLALSAWSGTVLWRVHLLESPAEPKLVGVQMRRIVLLTGFSARSALEIVRLHVSGKE
uniref:Uncharacterized protein n=1 Tax=Trichuris muris TaxID=70415 RepID=A0A5S6QMH1_TRIMR